MVYERQLPWFIPGTLAPLRNQDHSLGRRGLFFSRDLLPGSNTRSPNLLANDGLRLTSSQDNGTCPFPFVGYLSHQPTVWIDLGNQTQSRHMTRILFFSPCVASTTSSTPNVFLLSRVRNVQWLHGSHSRDGKTFLATSAA